MTMTDTEAKALALVNEVVRERGYTNEPTPITREYCTDEALCRAIERLEAAEARHAAELREQAERFSGVVTDWFGRYSAEVPPQFQPFIIPAPDPLVEYLVDVEGYFPRVAKEFADRLRLATREGKIVWETGE